MEPKKDPSIDVRKRRIFFLLAGFMVALGVVLSGLTWKRITIKKEQERQVKMNTMDQQMVQPNQPKKPKKKKPKQTTKVKEVEDKKKIEKDLTIGDLSVDEDTEFNFDSGEDKPKEDKVFAIVEEQPSFPGGDGKMMEYIQEHIKYPRKAREMGTTGTVYVQFIVNKDGSITNVEVLKGIGDGCDKEAKRVVRNMPKWDPGQQRGRSVRVSVKIPIRFSLS